MKRPNQFDAGMLAGMLFIFAALGGNWLITPARHPESTPFQLWATVAGIVICVAGAVAMIKKAPSDRARSLSLTAAPSAPWPLPPRLCPPYRYPALISACRTNGAAWSTASYAATCPNPSSWKNWKPSSS